MASVTATRLVDEFRTFNRFYTRLIGTLSRDYLGTPFNLQEARVIYEVGSRPGRTAKEIRAVTGFDQGYLSRLISRLEAQHIMRRAPSADDGRERKLFLTKEGATHFRSLDARADDQGRQLLGALETTERQAVAAAFRTLQNAFGANGDAPTPIRLRRAKVGDVGWLLERHAVVYHDEFGYSQVFENYVAQGLPTFLMSLDARRDRLWVAEQGGRRVGCIGVHHVDDHPGWAKLRWFLVEKHARGQGLGARLLDEAIRFSRAVGYKGVFLWTVNDLDAARRLYEKAGFTLAEEKAEPCPWASWGHEQRWELAFGR